MTLYTYIGPDCHLYVITTNRESADMGAQALAREAHLPWFDYVDETAIVEGLSWLQFTD